MHIYRCDSDSKKKALEDYVSTLTEKVKKVKSTKVHIKSMSVKKFACNICSMKYSAEIEMTYHIANVHDGKKPFSCNVNNCDYKCSQKHNLETHISSVHDKIKPFKCEICSVLFSQKHSLKIHKTNVHEKKNLMIHML